MYRTHVRSSKDLLCSLCGKKIRWAADTTRYGVRLKRYAHKECYARAASSESAQPFPLWSDRSLYEVELPTEKGLPDWSF